MTKVVVTEEMVERAIVAANWGRGPTTAQHFRRILEAALNPPPEPEVEVTERMVDEGKSYFGMYGIEGAAKVIGGYRAMRRLAPDFNKGPVEPKATQENPHNPLQYNTDLYKSKMSPYRSYGNTYWNVGLKND